MKGKDEEGVFLVQRQGRVSIPRDLRQRLEISEGDYVSCRFRKATDSEILEEMKKR